MKVTETPKLTVIPTPHSDKDMVQIVITWQKITHANQYAGEIEHISYVGQKAVPRTFTTSHPFHVELVPKGAKVKVRVRGNNTSSEGNEGPWSAEITSPKSGWKEKFTTTRIAAIAACVLLLVAALIWLPWHSKTVSENPAPAVALAAPASGPASHVYVPTPPPAPQRESAVVTSELINEVRQIRQAQQQAIQQTPAPAPMNVVTTMLIYIGDNNEINGTTFGGNGNSNKSSVKTYNEDPDDGHPDHGAEPLSTNPADYKPVSLNNQEVPPWAKTAPSQVMVLPTDKDVYEDTVRAGENHMMIVPPGYSIQPMGEPQFVETARMSRGDNYYYDDKACVNHIDGECTYVRPGCPDQTIRWKIRPIQHSEQPVGHYSNGNANVNANANANVNNNGNYNNNANANGNGAHASAGTGGYGNPGIGASANAGNGASAYATARSRNSYQGQGQGSYYASRGSYGSRGGGGGYSSHGSYGSHGGRR